MDDANAKILAEIRQEIQTVSQQNSAPNPLHKLTALVAGGRLSAANAGAIFGVWLKGQTPILPELTIDPYRYFGPQQWQETENEVLAESWLGRGLGLKVTNSYLTDRPKVLRQALCELGPLRWLTMMVAGKKMLPSYAGKILDKFVRGMSAGLAFGPEDYSGSAPTEKELAEAVESILEWSELAQGVKDPKWELWARTMAARISPSQVPEGVVLTGVTKTLTEFIESLRIGVANGTLTNEQIVERLDHMGQRMATEKKSSTKTLTGLGKEATEAATNGGVKVGKTGTKPNARFAPMEKAATASSEWVEHTAEPEPIRWVSASEELRERAKKMGGSIVKPERIPAKKIVAEDGPDMEVKAAVGDANSWKDKLTATTVENLLDGKLGEIGVDQLEKDIGQMMRQLPRLAPGREVSFEEFRRFIRWAIGNDVNPVSVKSFITTLHVVGSLPVSTIHEAGNISDLRGTDAGRWLRSFAEIDLLSQLQSMLPPGVEMKVIRKPEEFAASLGNQSFGEATEFLTMMVADGAMSQEFATATLDLVAATHSKRDEVRKQILSGMKNSANAPKNAQFALYASGAQTANLAAVTTQVLRSQQRRTTLNAKLGQSFEKDVHEAAQALESLRVSGKSIEAGNIAHLSINEEVFERTYAAIIKEHAAISGHDFIFASAKEAFALVNQAETERVAHAMAGGSTSGKMANGKMANGTNTGPGVMSAGGHVHSTLGAIKFEGPVSPDFWGEDSDSSESEAIGADDTAVTDSDEDFEELEKDNSETQLWLSNGLTALATQVVTGNERSVRSAAAKLDYMVRNERLDANTVRDGSGKNVQAFELKGDGAQAKFEDAYRHILHNANRSIRWSFPDPSEAFATLASLDKIESIENREVLIAATNLARMPAKEVSRYLAEQVIMGEMHTSFAGKVLEAQATINDRLQKIERQIQQNSKERGDNQHLEGNKEQERSGKMSKAQIAKVTVLDDMKEIALRTGVKRTRAILATKVAEFWAKRSVQRTAGESEEDYLARAERNREGVAAFLLSDAGQGMLAYMVGFAWPMLEDQIPDVAVKEYGAMVAREIRIQGGTEVLDSFIMEVVVPLGGVLKDEASKFAGATFGSGVQTRVATDTLDAGQKAEKVAALKRQLAELADSDHSAETVNGKTAAFGQ